MSASDIVASAVGVELVVHAANPAGYRNWKGLALPMLESSIAAAKSAGARLVFPGTVYNFGPEALPLVAETAPQRPTTRKGRIRVAMEERLREASHDGLCVLIVRAGDFFGPRAGNCWYSAGIVKPGRALRAVTYPGKRDVGHAWAYLPDLATTIVRLVERESELAAFDVFHFGGHWFERGVEIAEATRRVAGVQNVALRRFPWFAIYLLSPFIETCRELLEMRYLWEIELRLNNTKLVSFLGSEPHTATDDALRVTLQGLGCRPTSPLAEPATATAT